ncbi:MAG: hypothetical protein AAGF12_08495 [Myxococcota bacterium]
MNRAYPLALLLPLSLVLMAPAPGSVGACDGGETARGTADPQAFCEDLAVVCAARRRARGEIDTAEEMRVVQQRIMACPSFNFGCNPGPSDSRATACIERLMAVADLETRTRTCVQNDPSLPNINDVFEECQLCNTALTDPGEAEPPPFSWDPNPEPPAWSEPSLPLPDEAFSE